MKSVKNEQKKWYHPFTFQVDRVLKPCKEIYDFEMSWFAGKMQQEIR